MSSKLTALTPLSALSTDDLLYVVDNPGGTPTSKRISVSAALFSSTAPGMVPISSGNVHHFLRADGIWEDPFPHATADINFYVSTTGNDANDGLTALTPVLTIQRALLLAGAYNWVGLYNPIINVAAGTYVVSSSIIFPELLNINLFDQGELVGAGAATTIIQRASGDDTIVPIRGGGWHCTWGITGVTLDASRANIYAEKGANFGLVDCNFADSLGATGNTELVNCFHGGDISLSGTITVEDSFTSFYLGGGGACSFTTILSTINLPAGSFGTPGGDFFFNCSSNGTGEIWFFLNTINNAASFQGTQIAARQTGGTLLETDDGDLTDIPGESTNNLIDNNIYISKVGTTRTNIMMAPIAAAPTATDLNPNTWGVFQDTSSPGAVYVAANVGGVIKKVTLT